MRVATILGGLCLSVLLSACGRLEAAPPATGISRLEAENRALRERLDPLPASLDRLYPPAAGRPVYLLSMVDLATALDAVAADALEGDVDGARRGFERFAAVRQQVAALVPEWRASFPDAPVEALAAAVRAGEVGPVMAAIEAIEASCTECHLRAMTAAHHRYRWKDFAAIRVTDPASGAELPFSGVMHGLATRLAGIATDVAQGQVDAARRHLEGLRQAYESLEETCGTCHATGRAYYVGDAVRPHLDELERELGRERPDLDAVIRTSATLGEASCMRCHLVHVPAALSAAARRRP